MPIEALALSRPDFPKDYDPEAGDAAARQELLDISMRRLRLLSGRILSDIPAVRNFEETDDLLQNSVVRLCKYLSSHQPETSVDYFRLAACLI